MDLTAADGSLLVGGNDGLYRTSNKGQQWRVTTSFGYPYSAALGPKGKLYLCTSSGLFASTDNGVSWTLSDTSSLPRNAYRVACNSVGHAFLLTSDPFVLRSVDGTSWTKLPYPGTYSSFLRIHPNGSLFVIVDTIHYRSTDNGNSWTTTKPGFSTTNMYFDINGDIYAGSATSGYFVSMDNGTSWRSAGDPVNKGCVILRDRTGRLYAFDSGVIYRSTDDGMKWEEKVAGIDCLTFQSFFTCSNGSVLASTTRGILRSFDQGENWNPINSRFSTPPTALTQASDGSLHAATPLGVQRSTDYGLTWGLPLFPSRLATSVAVSQTGVLFVGLSDSIRIFRSTDSGNNWTPLKIDPTITYGRTTFLLTEPPSYVYAATTSGVFVSSDNGSTWSTVSYKPTSQIASMKLGQDGKLWVLSTYGYLFWSADRGKTWMQAGSVGFTVGTTTALAIDWAGNLFVGTRSWVGSYGYSYGSGVFRSTDAGTTWMNFNFGIGKDAWPTVQSLGTSAGGYLLVGLQDQGLYRSATVTAVKDSQGQILPTTFSLEQNYPNPFNPSTQIRFSLPVDANVRITIYNLLGQQVATVLESALNAGIHEATWDGQTESGVRAATGVYFYKIEAGSFIQTKKALLIK